MRILKQILSALALCSVAFAATASPAAPINGVEYRTLEAAQPTDTGKKVEVIEFFAYSCPHCNALEPQLEAWVRKQGDNIVFKRVHVPRDDNMLPQQRLFYTLEAMGLLNKLHKKVFSAMHEQRNRLNRDEQVFEWAAANGIDRQKFIDTYRSFGVQAKVKRAEAMMDSYKIDSWPTLIVDGRYQASPHLASAGMQGNPSEAELHAAALQVMDFLVAKAKAEKK